MRRAYRWFSLWAMGACCVIGFGDCAETYGSFIVDRIIAPLMGKDP